MSRGRTVKNKWLVWTLWFNGFEHSTLPIRRLTSGDKKDMKRLGVNKFKERFEFGLPNATVDIIYVGK